MLRRKQKPIFPEAETNLLVSAIREAERATSGEVRVFVEKRCKYVDAIDRARQVFEALEMDKTELRNGILFYLAVQDHQLAVYADDGIHKAAGDHYWKETLAGLIEDIRNENIIQGLCHAIHKAGDKLSEFFPYDSSTDKNELPDEIVFGR